MAQITRKEFSKNETNKKQPERKKTMKNTNFKTKLIARIMLLVLLLASAVNFTACGKKGLEAGFEHREHPHAYWDHFCACKSNKREFDISDVALTFYYGGTKGMDLPSFGIYFENEEETVYLIKEIKNHNPEQYIVNHEYKEFLFFDKIIRTFTHSETITIPKELFVNNTGHILFYMKVNELGDLYLGTVAIYYKVEGNTVFLSEKSFDK